MWAVRLLSMSTFEAQIFVPNGTPPCNTVRPEACVWTDTGGARRSALQRISYLDVLLARCALLRGTGMCN